MLPQYTGTGNEMKPRLSAFGALENGVGKISISRDRPGHLHAIERGLIDCAGGSANLTQLPLPADFFHGIGYPDPAMSDSIKAMSAPLECKKRASPMQIRIAAQIAPYAI